MGFSDEIQEATTKLMSTLSLQNKAAKEAFDKIPDGEIKSKLKILLEKANRGVASYDEIIEFAKKHAK